MKIRKISFVLCAAGMAVALLSGCGGEYTGVSGENDGVSGGAVSGQAVSGQAVSEKKSEEKKLQWCNDTNLYYYEYDDEYRKNTMTLCFGKAPLCSFSLERDRFKFCVNSKN